MCIHTNINPENPLEIDPVIINGVWHTLNALPQPSRSSLNPFIRVPAASSAFTSERVHSNLPTCPLPPHTSISSKNQRFVSCE